MHTKKQQNNECTLHIGHRLCNVELYHTQIGRCIFLSDCLQKTDDIRRCLVRLYKNILEVNCQFQNFILTLRYILMVLSRKCAFHAALIEYNRVHIFLT
jgi:hypothetical protein